MSALKLTGQSASTSARNEYQDDPLAWQNVLAHQEIFEHFLTRLGRFSERYRGLQLSLEPWKFGVRMPLHVTVPGRTRIGYIWEGTALLYTDLCELVLRELLGELNFQYEYVPGTEKPHRFRAGGYEGIGAWSPLALLRLCEQLAPRGLLSRRLGKSGVVEHDSAFVEELRFQPPKIMEWEENHLHLKPEFARRFLLSPVALGHVGLRRECSLLVTAFEVALRTEVASRGVGLLMRHTGEDSTWQVFASHETDTVVCEAATPQRAWHKCFLWSNQSRTAKPNLVLSDLKTQLQTMLRRSGLDYSPERLSRLLCASEQDVLAQLDVLEGEGRVIKAKGGYRGCTPDEAIAQLLRTTPQRQWSPAELAAAYPALGLSPSQVQMYVFAFITDGSLECDMRFQSKAAPEPREHPDEQDRGAPVKSPRRKSGRKGVNVTDS